MNKFCGKIWLSEKNIDEEFDKLTSELCHLKNLKKSSSILLEEIGFHDKSMDYYFRKYFKELFNFY